MSDELGFDVSAHPEAASQVAKDMQSRLAADAQLFARQINASSAPRVRFLLDADASVADTPEGGDAGAAAEQSLRELNAYLTQQREADAA